MNKQKNITSTESKTPDSIATPTDSMASTPAPADAATQTADKPTAGTLPAGYLADGSMLGTDGVMCSEYVGTYAEALAKTLNNLPASTFYSAFLREAKALKKKKTPYGAQKNCALGMAVQAKKLVARKKDPAPSLLLDMITAATATVKDPETFGALYLHLDAVYSFMLTA